MDGNETRCAGKATYHALLICGPAMLSDAQIDETANVSAPCGLRDAKIGKT